ncbi:MAG: glycogen synthase GlgA [candidate division WOR-3 bacterium]
MRIAMIVPEVAPFSKTGGLADVAGSLPKALVSMGAQVVVISPCYRAVTESGRYVAFTEIEVPIKVGERVAMARFFRKKLSGVEFYFVGNREFFDRDFLYGDSSGDYRDNCERFVFFCRAALEGLLQIDFAPDIVHCHDWQSGLVPIYLRELYCRCAGLDKARTVFTVHNLGYQGRFPAGCFPILGLPWEYFTPEGLEFYGQVNFLKAGLRYSDLLTTVSPTYACEIQTPELGFGLDGVLRARRDSLVGILNGLDTDVWDPRSDRELDCNYGPAEVEAAKGVNKRKLAGDLGLGEPDRPLLSLIARLSAQKGLELLSAVADSLIQAGANVAVLGMGDEHYHSLLREVRDRHPGRFALVLRFDEKLAHRLYAASDVFLIPSQYEPCGLGQMISFRYGTVPIAYRTGGLADTIVDVDQDPERGNGFLFGEYTPDALRDRVLRALQLHKDKEAWSKLMQHGMAFDCSWRTSAARYLEVFLRAASQTELSQAGMVSSSTRRDRFVTNDQGG